MKFLYKRLNNIIITAAIIVFAAVMAVFSVLTAAAEAIDAPRIVIRNGLSLDRIAVIGEDGSYIRGGHASRLDWTLDEEQINYGTAKFTQIITDYLDGSQIYFSIVPDKNYFLAEDGLYPRLDYDRMVELMRSGMEGANYIDLFPLLILDDYYRTDAHWDQCFLLPAAQALADMMGLGVNLMPSNGFVTHEYSPFAGLYARRYSMPLIPDTIRWLTSAATEAAVMTGPGLDDELPVYTTDKLTGNDAYDVFAGGPQSILTIESPLAKTERELIIFRDSFGSSIAPLLLEGYAKITLIDLRFMPAALLGKYVDFHGQDVLFLYSTTLLNSAKLLK